MPDTRKEAPEKPGNSRKTTKIIRKNPEESENAVKNPDESERPFQTAEESTIFDEPLRAVEDQIRKSRGCAEIRRFMGARKELYVNRSRELNRRKAKHMGRPARYPDAVIDRGEFLEREDAGIPDEEIDRIVQQVGVSKDGGLNPPQLLAAVKAPYQKNPTIVRLSKR